MTYARGNVSELKGTARTIKSAIASSSFYIMFWPSRAPEPRPNYTRIDNTLLQNNETRITHAHTHHISTCTRFMLLVRRRVGTPVYS